MSKTSPLNRDYFFHFQTIPTRWMDNDVYRHINNVVYYSFFDTAVNQFLIEQSVLDIEKSTIIGLVVETQCQYFSPITFPDIVTSGIRVDKIGKSSVHYSIGLFRENSDLASAQGSFVHVYVDAISRRPTPISKEMLTALKQISASV
ncbi:MAG: thioesterase family protein [Proteobacteria bacterium]|nr:thioesterase family protein [Pseudomonadota bacterium]MDA1330977.1 thioesterase family protein [Pseudomonadota bacterium]